MPQKDWCPGNWHSLVIFYPPENKNYRKSKQKWYIVITEDCVIPARWDGKKFLDVDGEAVNNVKFWGRYPTHPKNIKDRRW